MQKRSKDIRIINLSQKQLLDIAKEFLFSENLEKTLEISEKKITILHAVKNTCSSIQLWWRGEPQLFEIKIEKLQDTVTKVSIFFDLKTKYRLFILFIIFLYWICMLLILWNFGPTISAPIQENILVLLMSA